MSRQFRNAVDDFIEQQERMRRLLEPDYLRLMDVARQAQEFAQPMMEAARIAEETMRPLANAAKMSEDMGRQLAGATILDNTSVALSKALGSELEATQRALAGSGVLDYIKNLDHLTAGWRTTFSEVDAITKAMGSTFADVDRQASDAVAQFAQPELASFTANAWKGIESGLRGVDPKLVDQLTRPFTDSIGETLRQIESLHLPQLETSVFGALRATAKAFPDVGSLAGGLKLPNIDFAMSDGLAHALERFAASAQQAARRKDTAGLETLLVKADAVVAAATTDEEKRVLSPFVRMVLLTIVLNVVGTWTAEALEAAFRGMLPYLVAILTGVQAPAVLPPAGWTVPALVAPAPPLADGGPLVLPRARQVDGLPVIIRRAGPSAQRQTLEFFAAKARNPNTRQAYANAVMRFMHWCEDRDLELVDITAFNVTTYIEEMKGEYAAATVNQHLAAIRTLFDYLVVGHVLPMNPASEVRGPKHIVNKTRTPVLQPDEARLLLDSIDVSDLSGVRDRALLAVMVYGCARVSAVVAMDVRDYYQRRGQWWLRLHEKGGKQHELPVHRQAQKYLNAYIAAAMRNHTESPLWRTMTKHRGFSERRMSRVDVFRMVKRRARGAKVGENANCHTLRATGITTYLLNGGSLEGAQAIASHEDSRTTNLYVRAIETIAVSDIERIEI